ncbi:MAG: OB-fold domain-containing protein [Actinomycetia bacterium]|nr:OB-fold domain-containing protein [Actinomycetes bacterium]
MRPAPVRGLFEEPLWAYVRQGELRLQRCRACGRFMYPPAPVCAACWSEALEWVPVGGGGRVVSWTRFHRTYFPELPAPYVVAAVELDEGPIVIADTMPTNWAPRIGQRVRLVFDAEPDGDGPPLFHWAAASPGEAD